jgi:hypothetical protein
MRRESCVQSLFQLAGRFLIFVYLYSVFHGRPSGTFISFPEVTDMVVNACLILCHNEGRRKVWCIIRPADIIFNRCGGFCGYCVRKLLKDRGEAFSSIKHLVSDIL